MTTLAKRSSVATFALWCMVASMTIPEVARAAAGEPATRIVGLFGGRANVGELGRRYAYGYLWGLEAGYQPSFAGVSWTWLVGTFSSSDSANVDIELSTIEMNFSLRARFPFAGEGVPVLATGQIGVDLVRTSTPIPPDFARGYVGPALGVGLDLVLGGEIIVGLGARYSLLGTGPAGVSVLFAVGAGSGGK